MANPGLEAVLAQQGLIYAGIAVPESDNYLAQGLELLEAETKIRFYPMVAMCPEIRVINCEC